MTPEALRAFPSRFAEGQRLRREAALCSAFLSWDVKFARAALRLRQAPRKLRHCHEVPTSAFHPACIRSTTRAIVAMTGVCLRAR